MVRVPTLAYFATHFHISVQGLRWAIMGCTMFCRPAPICIRHACSPVDTCRVQQHPFTCHACSPVDALSCNVLHSAAWSINLNYSVVLFTITLEYVLGKNVLR